MNSITRSGGLLLCLLIGPASPGSARSAGVEDVFHDEFLHRLGEGWSFEREDRLHWRTGPAGLEVCVQPGNMWGGANNARNVLVRPVASPMSGPVEISVTVSNQPTAQWEQANLVWYYDAFNMVKLRARGSHLRHIRAVACAACGGRELEEVRTDTFLDTSLRIRFIASRLQRLAVAAMAPHPPGRGGTSAA